MPQSGFTQLNAPRRLASKYARADEKQQNALAESQGPNMDPYNIEAAVTGLGSSIQGFTPGNPQSIIDYLGNLGGITRMATMNRGGMGPIELPDWTRMARSISKRAQDVPDTLQAGNLAALERIASEGATGREATNIARSAMRHYTPEGTRAVGVDVNAAAVIRKARTKLGEVGSDQILAEVQRLNPKLTKNWTTNTIHDVDAGKRARPLSLDAPVSSDVETTVGEGLAGLDRADALASINEQVRKLSPAMQKHVQDLMSGDKLPQDLNPKTLASLRSQMKGGTAISGKTLKPISGGSSGGGVMSDPEYQAAANVELKRLAEGGSRTQRAIANDTLGSSDRPMYADTTSRSPWVLDKPVYHVSPQGPGINEAGRIEARASIGGQGGGLGGAAHKGVSTATSFQDADEIARIHARYGHVARQGRLMDDTVRKMAELDGYRKGWRGQKLQQYVDSAVTKLQSADAQRAGSGARPLTGPERLTRYYQDREAVLDVRNPHMMFPDSELDVARKTNQLKNATPEGIRTYKIPPQSIPKNTNVTMGSDPGEVRIPADIPVNQTTAYKYAPGSLLGLVGTHLIRHRKEDAE